MQEWKEIMDRALTLSAAEGGGDVLALLRRRWGRWVPQLLEDCLDRVQESHMGLPDGQVLEALGQELSALGWDLYDLEAGEGHRLVLVPGAESLAFARDIRQETGYCRRMGQPGRDRGRPARRLSPERWLPREEYALSGSTRYVMDAIAGDFGCGCWMERDAGDWQGSCVFDLRELPPRIVRLGRKKRFTRLTYSPRQECYAAVYAPSTAAIWTVAAGLDPLCADDWSRPMDLTFDTCPRRIWWLGKYLCAGDREKAACAWVRGGTARESHRLRLPEGEVPRRFAVDGLDRLYLADGTEGGPVYRWEDGRAVPLPFALEDGEDLGESVPVPGTGHLWLLRRTHGTELLDLDMETGARRVRPLDGVEPEAALRPLWGDWAALVNGPHGEGETAAWFWNRRTGEELRLTRSMLGGARLDQLGALTDGTVVFTALRPDGEQVLCRPTAFWAHLRKAAGGGERGALERSRGRAQRPGAAGQRRPDRGREAAAASLRTGTGLRGVGGGPAGGRRPLCLGCPGHPGPAGRGEKEAPHPGILPGAPPGEPAPAALQRRPPAGGKGPWGGEVDPGGGGGHGPCRGVHRPHPAARSLPGGGRPGGPGPAGPPGQPAGGQLGGAQAEAEEGGAAGAIPPPKGGGTRAAL